MRVTKWLGGKRSNSVRVAGHKVQFRACRCNRATGQKRRHFEAKERPR
jgi:hypothetical protein